jgi:hypothetical protein
MFMRTFAMILKVFVLFATAIVPCHRFYGANGAAGPPLLYPSSHLVARIAPGLRTELELRATGSGAPFTSGV